MRTEIGMWKKEQLALFKGHDATHRCVVEDECVQIGDKTYLTAVLRIKNGDSAGQTISFKTLANSALARALLESAGVPTANGLSLDKISIKGAEVLVVVNHRIPDIEEISGFGPVSEDNTEDS